MIICKVEGCGKEIGNSNSGNKKLRLCNKHNLQLSRHGRFLYLDDLKDLLGEEWRDMNKPVLSHRYEISNMGRLRSIDNFGNKKIRKLFLNKRNELECKLDGVITIRVKAAVLKAFVPNPFGDTRGIYLDGNSKNCRADNLQWYGVFWHDKALSALRQEAENGNRRAADIVAFMEGNEDRIIPLLKERMPKLTRLLWRLIPLYCQKYKVKNIGAYPDDIAQETFLRAIHAIRRGLLRHTTYVPGWFAMIAKNILKNKCAQAARMKEVSLYQNYFNSGDEYDITDRIIYEQWLKQE